LVPKKAKEFKEPTAKDLKLSEKLVSDFIDFYWARVRKHMSDLEHEAIQIPNLGTFKVKHWRIDETVEKHKATIVRVEGKFAGYQMMVELTKRIEKLEKIKELVQKRELKFKEIKDARKNKDNMEEPGSDMGGLQEPDIQE
jgi:nucleoid DNA-binding protein